MKNSSAEPVLDVRPLLAAGQEPRAVILTALEQLKPGEALRLVTPFEPLPLLSLAASLGFEVTTKQAGNGVHETRLLRVMSPTDRVIEVDLRTLPPPEPMQKALEAARQLGRHETLLVLTRFRPVHLIEHLESEGWLVESEEAGPDHWETMILRASAPHAP